MKIILSKEEVTQIVKEHLEKKYPGDIESIVESYGTWETVYTTPVEEGPEDEAPEQEDAA